MKLKVKHDWSFREFTYKKSEIILVSNQEAEILLLIAPDMFEVVAEVKHLRQPPLDRMMRQQITK